MTTDNIAYGTTTAITCTITALGNSATVGRQCTVVTNTNLYDDVMVTVGAITNASAPTGDKACYVYFFGSEDATLFDSDDAQPGANDATYTINLASNLRGPGVISCPAASKIYYKVFSLASFFGGLVPRKWGFVFINFTGNSMLATTTNPNMSYTGVSFTNS